jgi:SNF2 family DNA or RNA helicase
LVTATLNHQGSHIHVDCEYRDRELVKSIPGSMWKGELRQWWVPLSWGSCVTLRGVFGERLQVAPPLHNWAWHEKTTRVDPALELRDAIECDEGDPRLRPYQRAGVKWLKINQSGALLADDMGSGKGVQLPAAIQSLIDDGADVLPGVVICPNSTKRNWRRELLKWAPSATPYVLEGSMAVRRKTLQMGSLDPTAVFIVNIESVRQFTRLAPFGSISLKKCRECNPTGGEELVTTAQCEVHERELNRIPLRTVIFDEVHRAKDPKSKQTRAWWALTRQADVTTRWVATGTPVAKHLGDLWSIAHGIAPQDWPTKSKAIDRYALQSWNSFGGMEIVGINAQHAAEFYAILDTRFRRMRKEIILPHLPPKIRTQRYVQMSAKQAKAYRELETGLLTRLDDGSLLFAPNNLTAHLRLLQLSSSYAEIVKEDPTDATTWSVRLKDPSPKIDEVLDVLTEIGPDRQVAVCAASRQLIDLTAARLQKEGISYSLITGKVTEAERDFQLTKFQEGKTRVMLFTIAAGGTGLTMTAADTIIFMQRSWSMIENRQAEDRVHRIGSEIHSSVNIIDIITEETVEETHQLPKLLEKLERLEEIVRDKAALIAAGKSTLDLDNEEAKILSSTLM